MEKVKERDGFSLMEMIIVIAILGMITGGIAVTYNMVRSADVKGMAYDIDSSLTNLKSKNMGSNKHLYKQSGNYFIDYTEEESYTPSGEGESVGESGISLKYDGKELTDGEVITIGIQKKDGAFSVGPEEIEVYDNNVNDYMVYLVKDTGKHYVEELQ
jgi:prepilin-type N-terminal cleavage/methylation domain-containing protein